VKSFELKDMNVVRLRDQNHVLNVSYKATIDHKENEMHKIVIDLTDLTVLQEIDSFREINTNHIPTEEILDDNQIVETVLVEQLEREQGDPNDSDKEPPKIFAAEGLNRLKTFISFAEQMDIDFFFNNNDLTINYVINEYSSNEADFPYNNNFSDNNNNFFGNNLSDNYLLDDYFYDNYLSEYNFSDDGFSNDGFSDNDNDFSDNDFSGNNNFSDYSGFSDNYDNYSDDYE
ncbi:495_t:CDS:2, partial [Racocetra fulgida]